MPVSPLEIEEGRPRRPRFPKSLIFVFIGLLIAAIGFQFMDVGRESRLYAPIKGRIGQLSLDAFKNRFTSISEKIAPATPSTSVEENSDSLENQDPDRISENFRITNMELPTLFNLIVEPYGEEAVKAQVPSRPTLLYDLSFVNISSTNWDLTVKTPSRNKNRYDGKIAGRKQLPGSG